MVGTMGTSQCSIGRRRFNRLSSRHEERLENSIIIVTDCRAALDFYCSTAIRLHWMKPFCTYKGVEHLAENRLLVGLRPKIISKTLSFATFLV
jgi:hypothetical protein